MCLGIQRGVSCGHNCTIAKLENIQLHEHKYQPAQHITVWGHCHSSDQSHFHWLHLLLKPSLPAFQPSLQENWNHQPFISRSQVDPSWQIIGNIFSPPLRAISSKVKRDTQQTGEWFGAWNALFLLQYWLHPFHRSASSMQRTKGIRDGCLLTM